MKVILYMAPTANGYIARENGNTSFVSNVSWKSWDRMSRTIGNLITGRITFESDVTDGLFPCPDRLNVVMAKHQIKNKWGENVIFTDKSPKGVLQMLSNKGFNTTFVGGGGELNSSFLKANLVDEIYLDIEPVILGIGVKLFADSNFEVKLKLVERKMLSKNEIQLHYKVFK